MPLSSSKGSSLWFLWIVVYQGIPLFRRIWKTPCCTKPHFKGSRLGPRSYYPKSYFIALFLTIPKLSLHFLQVFWLWSNIIFKLRPIWSGHPVLYYYYHMFINKSLYLYLHLSLSLSLSVSLSPSSSPSLSLFCLYLSLSLSFSLSIFPLLRIKAFSSLFYINDYVYYHMLLFNIVFEWIPDTYLAFVFSNWLIIYYFIFKCQN